MSDESVFKKKVFLDEVANMNVCEMPSLFAFMLYAFEPEEIIDRFFEAMKNTDSYKIRDLTTQELVSYLDDNFVNDPALSIEENLRNGFRILKEFLAN